MIEPRSKDIVLPSPLRRGDGVALVSPAYRAPMESVEATAEVLRGWGFEPVVGAHAARLEAGRYAGTEQERLADLRSAFGDPQIKAILCNRGGYGTLRLLESLRGEDFSAAPKWLIGYSDITTLLAMETCAGVAGIHGPMCTHIGPAGGGDRSSLLLRDLLLGEVPCYELPAHPQNRPGKAFGTLVGGNLCTFVPLLGTWADPTLEGPFVLFVEEVEESMHHIDRLFCMLRLRGVLERCAGVVLGDFTDCGAEFDYGSVEAMLLRFLEPYDIPVLCGFPAGHGTENLPLVMGAPVTVEVRGDGASLRFDIPLRQRTVCVSD